MRHPRKYFKFYQRFWMPLALGILLTLAVLGIGWQFSILANHHLQQLVQHEATVLDQSISRELTNRIQSLQRMADRWQAQNGMTQAQWEADASIHIRDFYGFQAIEWVDPSFHVRWVVPLAGNEGALNLDLSREFRRQTALRIARDLRQPILTGTVSLVQGGKGLLVSIPMFGKVQEDTSQPSRFDGFIVAVFRVPSIFESILRIPDGFQVRIYDDHELIYGSQEGIKPLAFQESVMVEAYGVNWQVQVAPTPEFIAKERSPLPTVVLLGGLLTVWMLVYSLYLGQRLERHVQQIRQVNQQFESEIAQRQQIETELRESEERWQLALRGNNDGIWDWNLKTNEVFFSSRWKAMLGFTDDEISNQLDEWENRVHPDDLARVKQLVQDHLAGKTPFYVTEHRMLCKDGSFKWVLDRGQALWDSDGNVIRMTGSHTDITESKQAEVALRESEERYRQLIHNLNAGFVIHAPDTRILMCNASACNLLGLSVDQMMGKIAIDPAWRFIREDETVMPAEEYPVNYVLKTGAPLENYVLGVKRGGSSTIWVLVNAFPEFDSEQQLKQMVVTFIDITQLKQVEAELRRMGEVMENVISGISKVDAEGRYLYVNKAYANTVGYQPEELLGMFWHQTVYPDDLPQVMAAYHRMLQDGKAEVEARGIRKDGSIFYKQVVMIPIQDEPHSPVGHHCFMKDISDRKQAEVALQKELLRSKTLFNTSIDGIVVTDQQGDVVEASPSFAAMLGYSLEETLTLNVADWDAQWTRAELQALLKQDVVIPRFETRHRRQDGTVYDVEVSWHRVVWEGETLNFCTCRDISERNRIEAKRQQAEQSLRESEARFQAFMNHNPAAAWITDADGVILYLSETYFRIFEFSTDDWLGKSIFDLYPQAIAQQFLENIQTVAHTGEVLETIEVAPLKNGTQGDVLVYKFPVPDASGQVLVGGVAIDVTQQHQTELALQLSEERLKMALEASGDGLWDWDIVTGSVYHSPRYLEILGYAPDEVMNLSDWRHSLHPDDQSLVLKRLQAHLKDSSVKYACDYQVRCKLGEWKWIADYGKVVAWDAQGKPTRMIGAYKDISDRKRKELELRQAMEAAEAANLAKSTFLANMSHELRTPLNVILGFAQIMAHEPSLTPSQREDLQTIHRSGDHLLSLINDILDLSKIEAGHFTLEETGIDLIALLHTLRTMLSERASSKWLQLVFDIAPEVPQFIRTDAQKLRQVLLNLLSNAIKFTNQGSVTLRVGAKLTAPAAVEQSPLVFRLVQPLTLQFEVTDTGVGIAAEDLPNIFDAFVQAEAGKKSMSGTGLGLTISRKLLELMGGEIEVVSTLGQGSTFRFTLPIYPISGIDMQPEQRDRLVIGLAPDQPHRRILVVDDQTENRLLMVRLLTQLGLAVQEANNGQEAVRLWQEWQPDLIWMDIRMPGIDGYEATRQIRAMEQEHVSVIIALTAQASQSDRALALAAGCNDYISKPFREETLFLKMSEYLGLQYLYADSPAGEGPALTPMPPVPPEPRQEIDPALLTNLPQEWLLKLEDAAVCGDDVAITDLAKQLSADYELLTAHLLNLGRQYQFEAILGLLNGGRSQA